MTHHKRDDRDDILDEYHRQLSTPPISAEVMLSELQYAQKERDSNADQSPPTIRCNTIEDTSLTDEEMSFLTSYNQLRQSSFHATKPNEQDDQLTHNNTNHIFASKIPVWKTTTPSANRQTLTKKEMDFLHELAQMPEELLEQLEQMKDVLEHDPRFEISDLFADTDDDLEAETQKKRLLPDAAVRRQVWLRREEEDMGNKSWTESSENPLCSSSSCGFAPNKHASTSSTELMGASSQDMIESSNPMSLQSDATIPTSNGKPRPLKRVLVYKIQQPPLAI